jgi:hypothetical protein
MNNFFEGLKIKSVPVLSDRRRWFLNFFASSMSQKVLFKFLLASIKTLTNSGDFTAFEKAGSQPSAYDFEK